MRVLLIQPEDSARHGPWTRERWDFAVDLGKSSEETAAQWARIMRCPLLRSQEFVRDVEDVREMGRILSAADGRLMDEKGIDWWSLWSLEILREATSLLAWQRMLKHVPGTAVLWTTRPGWPATAFAELLQRPMRAYGAALPARALHRVRRYARLSRLFSPADIKQIILDKHDPAYRWRARFSVPEDPETQPVVLVPSAYTNVSRVASEYARVLPQQAFLLVATRRSARIFKAPANVKVRNLDCYATPEPDGEECKQLLRRWARLSDDLRNYPELSRLQRLELFHELPSAMANGLAVRDAWSRLLAREPVCAVLCGDDSNVNTRLAVLLASQLGLPTLDFHHGAMDGFYLVKHLPSDLYLAKSELERDYLVRLCGLPADRVVPAAPSLPPAPMTAPVEKFSTRKTAIVFFSEPYENMGMRGDEVYRELLPRLHALARELERPLILKLHPFESAIQREKILRNVLTTPDAEKVKIVTAPLSEELLSETYAGITVESTTVLDCAARGIPCFLCGWLRLSPFGYLQQYARFAKGQVLSGPEDIARIPARIAARSNEAASEDRTFLGKVLDPQNLAQWLGIEAADEVARPA